jgi:hypothetical protein
MTGSVLMTVALATIAATAFAACGDDDSENPDEPQIVSISQNAVYAWIDAGEDGLRDYLSLSAEAACPDDWLAQAIEDFGTPADWLETKDIEFFGQVDATATVVLDMESGEREEQWRFIKTAESWRISEIGGLIPCRVPAV